jgi:hypothetical protein
MSYGLKGSSIWSIRSGYFRALNVLTKKSEQSLKRASVSYPLCPGHCFQQFRWQRFRRQLWRLRWTIGLHLPCHGWLHFPPVTSTTPSSLLSKKRLGPARRAGMAPVDFGGVGVEPSQGGLTILHSPAYERKWILYRAPSEVRALRTQEGRQRRFPNARTLSRGVGTTARDKRIGELRWRY